MSRPSSRSSCVSSTGMRLIPPIITSESDRQFLLNLNCYIDSELASLRAAPLELPPDPEQRYLVYKEGFNLLIEHVQAYKPLLSSIKAEYDECINQLARGNQDALYLSGKVQAMASEPGTLVHYKKRMDDLQQKMAIVSEDNDRLRNQIEEIRAAREMKLGKTCHKEQQAPKEVKKDNRLIPGLTIKQSTDQKFLQKELEKLDVQIKELNLAKKTRYQPKELKDSYKDQLAEKVKVREELQKEVEILKLKNIKLKVAKEAAEVWWRSQPPHQTIGDAVTAALFRANQQAALQQANSDTGEYGLFSAVPSNSLEEDDPTRDREAESVLEYIEKFNELLENGLYTEAALHAANSPKGILRTSETLHRFSNLERTGIKPSPVLAFCEALIATVPAYGTKPKENLCVECVKFALQENRLDLVSHWISQNRLQFSIAIGEMLVDYAASQPQVKQECMAMAQLIYTSLGAHYKAVCSMVDQGRCKQAVHYARTKASFTSHQYAKLVQECPSPALAQILYDNNLVSLGVLISSLYKNGDHDAALKTVLKEYAKVSDESKEVQKSNALNNAVLIEDTTDELWIDVAHKLLNQGYIDAATDIKAAVILRQTFRQATQIVAQDNDSASKPVSTDKKPKRVYFGCLHSESSSD